VQLPRERRPAPAFTLQFTAGAKPGIVRVVSTGCTRLAGACLPGSSASTDATARVQVDLGLLGGLRTPPAATLTLRGAFDADSAVLGVHNPDPDSGIAVHAGATIAASQARLSTPAGASLAGALVGNDSALASLSTDQFFTSYFGLDKAGWKSQPAVAQIACGGNCSPALSSAVAAAGGNALVWVEGDLTLTGPLALGTVQRPVVIIVNGALRIDGAVMLHGLVYSQTLSWDHTTGSGAAVRGALISEADYRGNGAPELFYDTELLALLNGSSGSFVRVSGSWRDF
jgi:hypothetical protein